MVASALFEKLVLSAPHITTKQFLPAFVYGTAWKKDATTDLVYSALCNGFRAIDTACQPKHYREDLVGAGVRRALQDGKVQRSDLYLQTKFTSVDGQDPKNMPYDASKPLPEQVHKSIETSLYNLRIHENFESDAYLDTVVLHSPMRDIDQTMEVWHTLEGYVPNKIRNLGISNCNQFVLMDLCERATIKPSIVQNRFYAGSKYDNGLRKFCEKHGIVYQSFWTLSANPGLLKSGQVKRITEKLQISPQATLYSLVLGLRNTVILNGSTDIGHIKDDWKALETVKSYATSNEDEWEMEMLQFRKSIGQP